LEEELMRFPFAKLAFVFILMVAGAALAPLAAQAQQAAQKYRVVFHVTENDPQKWNIVLNNVGNVQKDLGKQNVMIEIVTHGPGLEMLKSDSKVGPRLAQALDNNVVLDACENTMRAAHVTKADMYAGVTFVPSGVTHILKRESEGWLYLRP
jgi:intracellular sulfur oxidation DsrE/DsrF family protein